jgi:tetratricopeptide (TPR) repeat protein
MQQGLIAIRAGRPADALAPLQAVSKRGIDTFEPHFYLARAYAGLERWRKAAAEYERAIAKVPGDTESWRGLGESRIGLRDGVGESLLPDAAENSTAAWTGMQAFPHL